MNVTHKGIQRIKAWRRGVAQCMNNGSHETETGGETHLIRARATMLGSPPNKMDQRYPQGNRPAHTTVAKSEPSATQDPQNEPSEKVRAQGEPLHFSRLNSSRSENGETSNKKASKEKKKQRHLDHERARRGSDSTPAATLWYRMSMCLLRG